MAMSRTDEVGAEAAAQYFLGLYPYVMQTGDFADWDAMSFESCHFCAGIRESASEIASSGDTYIGGDLGVTKLTVLPIDEDIRGYPVDAVVSQESSRRLSSDGALVEELPSTDGSARVDTLFTSGHWVILAVVTSVK